ncbi:MAG: DNA polymerase IV [Oscillospiraceae bacterium]|nr:DNA polymerase IV [Oscillospiraceae bacterium]
MKRLIFHIDVNSAYLSWEAAKRVANGEEDIRLIPSAIGGDREKRTGIILAKSIAAKKYGVKTGEPVGMALRKCPELQLFRPDFLLYQKNSAAFMEICGKYAPVLEKYSIDECFLDMSGTEMIYPDPVEIAYKIKDEIRDTLGFTVNVGIGSNKLLAKMASDFEKPDKVHTLFDHEIEQKLWPLPIGELFTVGHATEERLKNMCIRTVGELAKLSKADVEAVLGVKWGAQLHNFANGIDDTPVSDKKEEAKGYSVSTTLEEDVTDTEQAKSILLALADSVSTRMRSDGVRAYCVSVSIRANDFKNRSHQHKLDESTDITGEIYKEAVELFEALWDKKTPLRLLGIALNDIDRDECVQQGLFADEKKEKARKLDKAVDSIRERFGSKTIVHGANYRTDINVGKKYQAQAEAKKEKKTM